MVENLSELSFEEALAKLENIVRELEGGRIRLDDAVKAYEEATMLKKICENKLENAKLKIEKIEADKNGELHIENFTEEGM